MIRRWFCRHREMRRFDHAGIPSFKCHSCGHVVPQIKRQVPVILDHPAHVRMIARRVR